MKCGLGNGQKATGEPIKIGSIVTKQPGTDFTDASNMAQAFYDCVNSNGGIKGRPIQYIVEEEQSDPGQIAGLARKLVTSDKVLGMLGSFSLLDCAVNHAFYEANDLYTTNVGVAPECFSTPNSASINLGPRYSLDGGAQALIKQGVKKLVFATAGTPGAEWYAEGVKSVADAAGVPMVFAKENVPIQDANSIALTLVQQAGADGGVLLGFTPPEALKIMQAAQQQGLAGRVKWGCSSTCSTDFLAQALGPEWEGKLLVNAEVNTVDSTGPDNQLYLKVHDQYAPKVPVGSFGQMGFVLAKLTVDRLLSIDGPIDKESVNKAMLDTKGYKSDLVCKPWYYGKAPVHIPNNTGRTLTPKAGKLVVQDECADVTADDPQIAKVRKIEQEQGL
ncbi:ABC transporter substrate-binding protein [Capillimicrobium parvum]|uniref:ABC transporter substrate-binding protein n=1 Tax=Capillimicrobium parvum TaxID=2884022 RepID=UPI002E0D2893